MIVDCLVSLGRLDEAAKKLTEMIQAKPDQWTYIRTYVTCQVQRCQNFRERVRQQLERDREKEEDQGEEGEREEEGETSIEANREEKREGERQTDDTVKEKVDNDKDKTADVAETLSNSTEQTIGQHTPTSTTNLHENTHDPPAVVGSTLGKVLVQ